MGAVSEGTEGGLSLAGKLWRPFGATLAWVGRRIRGNPKKIAAVVAAEVIDQRYNDGALTQAGVDIATDAANKGFRATGVYTPMNERELARKIDLERTAAQADELRLKGLLDNNPDRDRITAELDALKDDPAKQTQRRKELITELARKEAAAAKLAVGAYKTAAAHDHCQLIPEDASRTSIPCDVDVKKIGTIEIAPAGAKMTKDPDRIRKGYVYEGSTFVTADTSTGKIIIPDSALGTAPGRVVIKAANGDQLSHMMLDSGNRKVLTDKPKAGP